MTITVKTSYILAAGSMVSVKDQPAFLLDASNNAIPLLTIAGSVSVTGSTSTVALLADQTGPLGGGPSILIEAGASVIVDVTGATTSANLYNMKTVSGVFTNEGSVHIDADNYAGVGYGIAKVAASNSGDIVVHAGTAALGWTLAPGSSFSNSGQLIVASEGTALAITVTASVFNNTGTITATGGAYANAVEFSNDWTAENAGTIVATATAAPEGSVIGVLVSSSLFHFDLHNTGFIRADVAIYDGGSDTADLIRNDGGRITGALQLNFADDQVANAGRIDGYVSLGWGQDLYDGSRGRISGAVFGDFGNDTIIGGARAETLYGDVGADPGPDHDDVAQGGDDSLAGGGGGDRLFGEGGNDTLIGGSGADTLDAGAGRDVLTGGVDADVFVFHALADSTVSDPDLITDLKDIDVINLNTIDANANLHGNQAFRPVAALDHHAGEAALVYDKAQKLTFLQLDVNGDGAADAVITISGDHHGFTNFVL